MIASIPMGKEAPTANRSARTFAATCALLATTLACTVVVLLSPRPVEPGDLPALVLERAQVEQQIAQDALLAQRVPRGELADRVLALYRQVGIDELAPHVSGVALARRRAELPEAAEELTRALGGEALDALRAATLEAAVEGLRGDAKTSDAQALLGAFPSQLARHGFIDARGALIAPELAVRALYKVRFNLLLERERAEGLSELERRALDGYIALHGAAILPPERARAARDFYDAHGQHAREALAVWLFAAGAAGPSRDLLARTFRDEHSLRARNMSLFVERHP